MMPVAVFMLALSQALLLYVPALQLLLEPEVITLLEQRAAAVRTAPVATVQAAALPATLPPSQQSAAAPQQSAVDVQQPATAPPQQQPAAAPPPSAAAASQPVPDRWAVGLDLGFASSTGNSQLTSLTTGVRLKHLQTRLFKLDWSVAFRYGESQGAVVARNIQTKLDFDVGPGAVIAPFVFASAERDPFRKLDLRARTGSGVKYTFYRQQQGDAAIRIAAQYSREHFTAAAAQDPRTDGAWNMQFRGSRTVGAAVKLDNTTTFAPLFHDFGDHTFDVASKISSRISRRLALTLTHVYDYDSTPASNVGRTDQRFQAGLTIDF